MLMVQKREAPSENANASQSTDMTRVPRASLMPYGLRTVLNVAVKVEKRTVEVMAARKVKRQATYFCISIKPSSARSVVQGLTEATIEVTQLPHLEQIAKMPTTMFARVVQSATTYAVNIHLLIFWYVFNPFWTSFGKTLAAPVPFKFHTSTGLNQKLAWRLEHLVNCTPPLLVLEPEQ
jgi:hypothetical protein